MWRSANQIPSLHCLIGWGNPMTQNTREGERRLSALRRVAAIFVGMS